MYFRCVIFYQKKKEMLNLYRLLKKKLIKKIKKSYGVKYDFEIISVFNVNKNEFFLKNHFGTNVKKS